MKLIGAAIIQDALPDILRMIESLVCCDEVFVVDGGSKDGTRKWIESVKELYHLRVYDHPFSNMRDQRNWLLERLPKDVWIAFIDQDEALNPCMTYCLQEYIKHIPANVYEEGKKEERVVTLDTPYLILKDDYRHYCYPYTYLRGKVFYNASGLKFYHPYHSEVSYSEDRMSQYIGLSVPNQFAIFHYAFFDKVRMEKRKARLEKLMEDPENQAEYEFAAWFEMERDVREIPESMLPPY